MGRTALALLVASLTLLAGGASAGGRSAWLPPAVLSKAGASLGGVAVDAQGGSLVVFWQRAQDAIEAATRSPGGRFVAAQEIARGGDLPALAADAAGDATLVWLSGGYPSGVVHASTRPAGGAFGPPQDLSRPAWIESAPLLAVGARGDAVAMWIQSDSPRQSPCCAGVLEGAFRPAGGRFGAAEDVLAFAADSGVTRFEVAMDSRGDAVVVWDSFRYPQTFVQAAYRPAGGSFGAPQTLAEANRQTSGGKFVDVEGADVAIDAGGNATAVWSSSDGTNWSIRAAYRPATSGAWQASQQVGQAEGCCASTGSVAVDTQGKPLAVWVGPEGSVQAATRSEATGGWQAPRTLSRPGDHGFAGAPAIAAGARGELVVAWQSLDLVEAAVRPAGGRFGPARDVSQAGVYVDPNRAPRVAVDPQGNALLAWGALRGLSQRWLNLGHVQAAGYDRAGPALRALRVPARGKVGRRLAFSVSPLDVWSQVASTDWSFGDGVKATGTRVMHAYLQPGRYAVKVVSTDTLGHATARVRSVQIGPK